MLSLIRLLTLLSFLRVQITLGLSTKNPKLLIKGVDFYRCFEYPETIRKLRSFKGKIILDIGSSDTIFPQFMAKEGAKVCAVDIYHTVKKQQRWSDTLKIEANAVIADARYLPLRDNMVDICTCISTIEHIQSADGDKLIMLEIERVLTLGGRLFICMPYSRTYEERLYSGKRGFMRRYDEKSLLERVVNATTLKLIDKVYYGDERYRGVKKAWYRSPMVVKAATAWTCTFIAPFIVSNTTSSRAEGVFLLFKKTTH